MGGDWYRRWVDFDCKVDLKAWPPNWTLPRDLAHLTEAASSAVSILGARRRPDTATAPTLAGDNHDLLSAQACRELDKLGLPVVRTNVGRAGLGRFANMLQNALFRSTSEILL